MHWEAMPSPKPGQYEQMLGDLPTEKLTELLSSPYRAEYFMDCKSFVYDQDNDTIAYKDSYDHIARERLQPDSLSLWDGDLLSSLTSWTPATSPMTDLRYSGSAQDLMTKPDRIDYVMNTMLWKGVST